MWAALTLIQNWIAKGQPEFSGKELNSYENWSRVIGGICETAGLGGFLGNREHLKESASTQLNETFRLFMSEIAKLGSGTKLRPGSTSNGSFSVLDMLNEGCDENGFKPFKMDGYGWDKETGRYEESNMIGKRLRELAAKPHTVKVDGKKVCVTLDCQKDTKNDTYIYVVTVEDV